MLRETAMLASCAGSAAQPQGGARGSDMHDLHLVMEYVVGRSLHDVIASRRRPLPRARTHLYDQTFALFSTTKISLLINKSINVMGTHIYINKH